MPFGVLDIQKRAEDRVEFDLSTYEKKNYWVDWRYLRTQLISPTCSASLSSLHDYFVAFVYAYEALASPFCCFLFFSVR